MAFNVLSIAKRINKFFANLRTGIVLLILTGIAAALGTFILQRPATDPDKMAQTYSPNVLYWLDRLTLTDIFHSWWFTALLAMVSLSIVLVSIDRFPNAWRFYARPYRRSDSHFRAVLPTRVELPITNAVQAMNAAERAMKKLHWPVERITENNETSLYSEKNRFSVMAVYIIHASLLLIFLGGIIDATIGFKGFITLKRGEQSNVVEIGSHGTKILPFALKFNSGGEETYADGSPKRWWSRLSVVQDGQEVQNKEIAVNDPLTYRGVRFYQASFGQTGTIDGLKLLATPQNGAAREITLTMSEPVELDPNTTVTLAEYIPDFFIRDNQVFKRSDDAVNPAFRLAIKDAATGQEARQWLFPAYNETAQGQDSSYTFAYRDVQMGYFTGLSVAHQPGQWLVWAGVLLMCAGLGVAFYMVHMRLWIVATPNAQGKLVLWVGGQANKNRDSFEQRFTKLVDNIRTELEHAHASPRLAREDRPQPVLAGVK